MPKIMYNFKCKFDILRNIHFSKKVAQVSSLICLPKSCGDLSRFNFCKSYNIIQFIRLNTYYNRLVIIC